MRQCDGVGLGGRKKSAAKVQAVHVQVQVQV